MDMDDLVLIANDIEEASKMISNQLDGELSKDEESISVCPGTITEIKKFLFSAIEILQEYN